VGFFDILNLRGFDSSTTPDFANAQIRGILWAHRKANQSNGGTRHLRTYRMTITAIVLM